VVEATSGNTGIALAMVCAAKGYPFVATMAESFSGRAPQDHAHHGREGDLTPAAERGSGMVRKARSWRRSTAGSSRGSSRTRPTPPITATPPGRRSLQDFAGRRLDFFVTGWGTGGTLTGAGEMLRLARAGGADHRFRSRRVRRCCRASRSRPTRSRGGRRTSCRRS